MLNMIRSLVICLLVMMLQVSNIRGTRMIRLCIASVDLTKLSSQCVMCNRREFPLTAIDCTGITKMNDLISNPLSVKEASCLILNCRRQVPNIEPEPYHGSVSHAARVNYASAASGTRSYGIMPPTPPRSSPYSTLYDNFSPSHIPNFADYSSPMQNEATLDLPSALSSAGGFVGSPMSSTRQQQALPYALVPAPYSSPFQKPKNTTTAFNSSNRQVCGSTKPLLFHCSSEPMKTKLSE